MNPNATEFVPYTKHEHAKQRKKQRSKESENLRQKINDLRQLLATENQELVVFHIRLKDHYEVLSAHMNAGEHYNEYLTEALRQRYQAESDKYYAKYRNFNDLTSKLLALEQTLHRILMHPDSGRQHWQQQKNTNSNKSSNENEDCQQQKDLNAMDGIKKNLTVTPHHALAAIMESDEECIDYDEYENSECYTDSDLSSTAYV